MSRYAPDQKTQEDGSDCQWTNCWATVGAWLADAASGGERDVSPTFFRSRAGAAGPDCRTGGLGDIMRGLMVMDLWGRGKYRVDVPRAELRRMLLRRTGYCVALETDFESWPESVICQRNFNDRENAYHGIGVICGDQPMHKGKVRVEDPLCHAYKWVDVVEVIQAAIIYNREHGERQDTVDCIVVIPPQA